jgi:hypothetical protein
MFFSQELVGLFRVGNVLEVRTISLEASRRLSQAIRSGVIALTPNDLYCALQFWVA